MSTRKPSVWAFEGDPALDDPGVRQALDELGEHSTILWLNETARRDTNKKLQDQAIDPPWVFVFGDLHVLLKEPLMETLSAIGEVSRLLISTHANIDLLESTINNYGLDQQVCLPASGDDIRFAVRDMIERTRRLQHQYDNLRLALR